jgi:hypothetical protein
MENAYSLVCYMWKVGIAKTPENFNAGVSAFFGAKPKTPAITPALI